MSDEVDEFCLATASGGRRTFSRELQDGHELLQGESEDLLDFHKRVTRLPAVALT